MHQNWVRLCRVASTAPPNSIQDLEYAWRSNGSLYRRTDKRGTAGTGDGYVDTFSYDALERVTQQTTTGGASRTLTFSYDLHGNLLSKTSNVSGDQNASGFTYSFAGKPHRLASVSIGGVTNTLTYDANGNTTQYAAAGANTYLKYDPQNNVTQITVGASEETPTPQARDAFWYDPDNQRFLGRETWDDNGTQRMRRVVYLGGDYEDVLSESGSTYDRVQRIQATSAALQVRRRSASTGVWETPFFEYLHRDHLGSVDAITNSAGVVQAKLSFDPFGGRRAAAWNGDLDATSLAALLAWQDSRGSRGFTSHEHLNRTGFVHMNGRVYDPRIGRFVSPDPIVQAPSFSQSYNRYAYVFNNPLSYWDPTGFFSLGNLVGGIGKAVGGVFKGIGKVLGNAFEKLSGFVKKYAADIAIAVVHLTGHPELAAVLAGARTAQQTSGAYRSRSGRRGERGGGWGTPGIAGPVFMMTATANQPENRSPGTTPSREELRAEWERFVTIYPGLLEHWNDHNSPSLSLPKIMSRKRWRGGVGQIVLDQIFEAGTWQQNRFIYELGLGALRQSRQGRQISIRAYRDWSRVPFRRYDFGADPVMTLDFIFWVHGMTDQRPADCYLARERC